ncbi:MAG: hypothetical protein M1313_08510 [Nitrospirae bacterium]|nr:hypothetical protein [Nitrospirota bacterium]
MTRRNIVSVALSDPEMEVLRSIPAQTDSERIRMLIRKLVTGEWIPEPGDSRKKKKD